MKPYYRGLGGSGSRKLRCRSNAACPKRGETANGTSQPVADTPAPRDPMGPRKSGTGTGTGTGTEVSGLADALQVGFPTGLPGRRPGERGAGVRGGTSPEETWNAATLIPSSRPPRAPSPLARGGPTAGA